MFSLQKEKLLYLPEFSHFAQPASAFLEFCIFTWVNFCTRETCVTTVQDEAKQEMMQMAECYFLFTLYFCHHWVIWKPGLQLILLISTFQMCFFFSANKCICQITQVMQKNHPNRTEFSRHFLSIEISATVQRGGGGWNTCTLPVLFCLIVILEWIVVLTWLEDRMHHESDALCWSLSAKSKKKQNKTDDDEPCRFTCNSFIHSFFIPASPCTHGHGGAGTPGTPWTTNH